MDNQTFSTGRFSHLAKKKLTEDWRQLVLSLMALSGVLALAGIWAANMAYYAGISPQYLSSRCFEIEFILFTIILFFSGTYVASVSFRPMAAPAGALSILMVPASQFEKFMLRWLVAVPLFLLAFFCLAVLADVIRVWYVSAYFDMEVRPVPWIDAVFSPEEAGNSASYLWTGWIYVAVQSFFLLGAIVWPRRSMLKTFVAGGLMTAVYMWFGYWIISLLHDEGHYYSGPRVDYMGDVDNAYRFMKCVLAFVALFNYWLAYRRFRESEIINRW